MAFNYTPNIGTVQQDVTDIFVVVHTIKDSVQQLRTDLDNLSNTINILLGRRQPETPLDELFSEHRPILAKEGAHSTVA
jgi:hypothetical protein